MPDTRCTCLRGPSWEPIVRDPSCTARPIEERIRTWPQTRVNGAVTGEQEAAV